MDSQEINPDSIISEPTIDDMMAEYIKINRKITELKREKETIKSMVLVKVKVAGIQQYDTDDNLRLSYKTSKRRTLDKDKLSAFLLEHNKSLEDFQEESEFEMLRIVERRQEFEKSNTGGD